MYAPDRACASFHPLVSLAGVAVVAAVLAELPMTPVLRAQAPPSASAQPAFETASVKPNRDPDGPVLFQALPGGRVNLINQTVRMLIFSAYQIQDYQLMGGPGWLASDRYDVIAKAEGNPPPPQMLLMVRTLLADRFRLAVHPETRMLPIYRLVLARTGGPPGPRLTQSACAQTDGTQPVPEGRVPCGNRGGVGRLLSGGITLDALANRLGRLREIGRPVVNDTGLAGTFDVDLTYLPDTPGSPPSPDALSIFTALQEQLGLRLESGRGPVDVLVIDGVERPTPD